MEGGENGRVAEEARVPLLVADGGRSAEAAARVVRKNSVHLMRGEFVARLPEKVRLGVDPERPFTIDVSRTKDLNQGPESFTSVLSRCCLKIGFSLSLFLCIYRPLKISVNVAKGARKPRRIQRDLDKTLVRIEVDSRECHNTAEADLPITKKGTHYEATDYRAMEWQCHGTAEAGLSWSHQSLTLLERKRWS
ncbi:hypothetical protein BHE74_00028356 [Ensete ventricosum]|nr:hypothetical protein GW17_00003075 [Ensete ventricosum]RWW64417.1 hypothetical protein BHE74_00028356 [Ensete ventricosum]